MWTLQEVVDDVIRRAYLAAEHGESVNAYALPALTVARLGIEPDNRKSLKGFQSIGLKKWREGHKKRAQIEKERLEKGQKAACPRGDAQV